MKRILALILTTILVFSFSGCTPEKKAEEFDTRIEELSTDDAEGVKSLKAEYDALDEKVKEKVQNTSTLEQAYCDVIVAEIKSYKNGSTSLIKSLIKENEPLLEEYGKLEDCILWYIRWDAYNEAINKLKPMLKDPNSLSILSGKTYTPKTEETLDRSKLSEEELKAHPICRNAYVDVTLEYTATNSYGGRVKSTARAKCGYGYQLTTPEYEGEYETGIDSVVFYERECKIW